MISAKQGYQSCPGLFHFVPNVPPFFGAPLLARSLHPYGALSLFFRNKDLAFWLDTPGPGRFHCDNMDEWKYVTTVFIGRPTGFTSVDEKPDVLGEVRGKYVSKTWTVERKFSEFNEIILWHSNKIFLTKGCALF